MASQIGVVDDAVHPFIAFEAEGGDDDDSPGGGRPTPTLFETSSTASFSNFVVKPGEGALGGDVFEFNVTITNTSTDPRAVLTAFAFQSKFSESPELGSRIGDKLFSASRIDTGEELPLGSVKKNAPAGGLFPGSRKFISINSSSDFPETFNAGEENEALEFGGARFVDENGNLFIDPTKGLQPGQSQTIRLALDFGTDDGALVRVPKGTITGTVIEDPLTGFPVLVDGSGNVVDIVEFIDVKALRNSDGTFNPSFATLDDQDNLVLNNEEYITLPRPNFAASDILGRNHTRSDYDISGLGDETEVFSFTDVGDLIPGVLNFEALLRGFGEGNPFVPIGEYYIQTEEGLFRQLLAGNYDEPGSLSATIDSANPSRSGFEEVPEDFSDDGPRQPRSGDPFGASARTIFSNFEVITDNPDTIENEGGAQGGNKFRFTMEITNTSPLDSGIYLTSFGYQTKQQGLADIIPEFDGFTQGDRRDLRGSPNGANLPIANSLSDINTYNQQLDIGQFPNSIGNTLLTAKIIDGAQPNKLESLKKNGPFTPILAGNSKFINVKSGAPAADQDADETSFGDPGTLDNRLGLAPGESQTVTIEMDYGDFRGIILKILPGTLSEDSPLLAALTPEERANFGLLSVTDNRDQRELEYAHPDVVGELIGFLPGSDARWLTPETLEEIIYITLNQPGDAPTVMNFGENFGQILAMAGFVPSAEFYKPDDAGNLLRQLMIGEYSVSTLPGDLNSFDFSFTDNTSGEFAFSANTSLLPANSFRLRADQLSAFNWDINGKEFSLFELDLDRSGGLIFEDAGGQNLLSWDLLTKGTKPNGGGVYWLSTNDNKNLFDQTASIIRPSGEEVGGLDFFGYRSSVELSFGQKLGGLNIQAFEDGTLTDSKKGRQNGVVPDVGAFKLFALDSPDSGRRSHFSDRTWLDRRQGIGIQDGDDGNTRARKLIDGDETLGISITGFAGLDALVKVDRITSDNGAEILVKAFNGYTPVHSKVFNLGSVPTDEIQTLNFRSPGFFDTLYISSADTDTMFTFREVELPVAFKTTFSLIPPGFEDAITGSGDLFGTAQDEAFLSEVDNVKIYAGEGNNKVLATGQNTTVFAGAGKDEITVVNGTVYAGEGENTITATGGSTKVYAGAAQDVIKLATGNNTVYAGEGNNQITTGDGDDLLYAGAGNDFILTGAGNDLIYAGEGNNFINAGTGYDHVYSGYGVDTFVLNAGEGFVTIYGVQPHDHFILGAGLSPETLRFTQSQGDTIISSGIDELAVLKWTQVSNVNLVNEFVI
ncbi:MAG: hypothetical protein KME23_00945 [Goleter apudmare HA4340-LM2]|nr:hypothetical protein [Goleter apudmare HA4340-LM2]